MNKLGAFLKLIRWPNLVMLALVQIITAFVFVKTLDYFHLSLVSVSTILIAAGGYIINDYYDYELDIANAKASNFTKKSLKNLFWFYSILGLAVGFYLSLISDFKFFGFFLFAFFILYSYAVFFSKYKIIGNVFISVLIAEAIIIIPYAAYFFSEPNRYGFDDGFSLMHAVGYALFAFLFNWLREIVKDLEDQKGDLLFKRKTVAIVFGAFNAKIFSIIILVLINFFLYISSIGTNYFIMIPISVSSLFLIFGLIKAQEPKDFKRASLFIKLMMLYGLLSPLFSYLF